MGGRHKYNGVLPGALRGLLVALLSPPQCPAALSTMPDCLVWVDHYSSLHPTDDTFLRSGNAGGLF